MELMNKPKDENIELVLIKQKSQLNTENKQIMIN